MLAVNVKGIFTVAIVGDVTDDVRSGRSGRGGQALLTVPETAGDEVADVPPAFVAVIV